MDQAGGLELSVSKFLYLQVLSLLALPPGLQEGTARKHMMRATTETSSATRSMEPRIPPITAPQLMEWIDGEYAAFEFLVIQTAA